MFTILWAPLMAAEQMIFDIVGNSSNYLRDEAASKGWAPDHRLYLFLP